MSATTGQRCILSKRLVLAALCCGPLLVTFSGCPGQFRHAVVDGMLREMRFRSEEDTYQQIRHEVEQVEGRPIP